MSKQKQNKFSSNMKKAIKALKKADLALFDVHLYESPIGDADSRIEELVEKYEKALKEDKPKKLLKLAKKAEKLQARLEKACTKECKTLGDMQTALRVVLSTVHSDIHEYLNIHPRQGKK
jgi:DNA-binding transcriptional regulator YbjK